MLISSQLIDVLMVDILPKTFYKLQPTIRRRSATNETLAGQDSQRTRQLRIFRSIGVGATSK
jgi:hypothetical protein